VTGTVTVAMVDTLPRRLAEMGVALVLGNDLAGTELSRAPILLPGARQAVDTEKLEQEFPEVLTACVVTRAQAEAKAPAPHQEKPELLAGLEETFMAHLAPGDSSLGRRALIDAQAADPVIAPLFRQVEDPGRGEVLPRATRVKAIADFPVPQTRRQLMRVVGMAGFYRKFVPNFATVTAPLTELLRKGVKWRWSTECQAAIEAIKAILSSKPVLVAPNFESPFCLAVDASEVGVGGVLLQAGEDGLERPVAYFSKKLNPHQKRYSTIEKEALALVLAVEHFEVFISGGAGDVVVYSDHNPLSFLAKFQKSSARVYRWSLSLQPYSIVIRHMAGKDNVIADALSRGPI